MGHMASALSLANFQLIASNAVPSNCMASYNSQIVGCSRRDFRNGRQCSPDCVQGLLQTSSLLDTFCKGVVVDPKTLLGMTMNGQLLPALCPGAPLTATTLTVTVHPTTTPRSPQPSPQLPPGPPGPPDYQVLQDHQDHQCRQDIQDSRHHHLRRRRHRRKQRLNLYLRQR
ncbi:hypothetical protein PG994_009381 [Apiospora phragmitis]|uniref:Uncharacterized protein n=1 Tax=Apiospora phragmitis TaxID=2905665 RepID=A0ABR1UJ42_9PEZI